MTRRKIAKLSSYEKLHRRHAASPDDLPVDAAVERAPAVARLRAEMLRLQQKTKALHPDQRLFLSYADACSRLASARAEEYFDQGHRRGEAAGHVDLRRLMRAGRALARRVLDVALDAGLPDRVAASALIESARAFTVGAVARGGRSRGRRGGPAPSAAGR